MGEMSQKVEEETERDQLLFCIMLTKPAHSPGVRNHGHAFSGTNLSVRLAHKSLQKLNMASLRAGGFDRRVITLTHRGRPFSYAFLQAWRDLGNFWNIDKAISSSEPFFHYLVFPSLGWMGPGTYEAWRPSGADSSSPLKPNQTRRK